MGLIIELSRSLGPVPVVAGIILAMFAIKLIKKTVKWAITLGVIAVILIVLGIL